MRTGLLTRLLIIVVVLAAYLTPFFLYFSESREHHVADTEISAEKIDLEIDAKLIATDLAKNSIQVQLIPSGGKLLLNGRMTADTTIEFDSGVGIVSRQFKQNAIIDPWTINIITDEGDILTYPFDTYKFSSDIQATSAGKSIRLKVNLEHVLHGFNGKLDLVSNDSGSTQMELTLSRSGSVLFVAILSTVSVLLVTIAVCIVAWHVVGRGRKFEFGMMVWSAALLFVIPSIRNALPGAIPIGALIDYAVFFWLQIAVGIAMCCLIFTWSKRP